VIVETSDGDTLAGVIRSMSAGEVVLLDTSAQPHVIPRAKIVKQRGSPLSLMPEGLHTGLTLQEFADLIAYLESLKPAAQPATQPAAEAAGSRPAFVPLFNGKDLTGWRQDGGDKTHWHVKDGGVLEHDGVAGDLWTTREFGDFVLKLEWRWPDPPKPEDFPLIDADGNEVKDASGKAKTERVMDAGDSGVFLRGFRKAQANLFCYPVGSGEVWEYRTDPKMSLEVKRGVTPKKRADKPVGEWNAMVITMKGDRMTVALNGDEVISNAQLPGVPAKGAIGFQHEHGRIQFRNIEVRELGAEVRDEKSEVREQEQPR
jgi:hypothetical protein